ncbi:MAG: hypothetical protein Q9N34_09435 [Aquificota bacterium]|nr:hypothetical protein [Aquificota bacterium]
MVTMKANVRTKPNIPTVAVRDHIEPVDRYSLLKLSLIRGGLNTERTALKAL